MSVDKEKLKALAEAFPADLDWDSNTEAFFNGPGGESLGGGSDGTYTVYGKPFRLEGEDYDYDGPTYVERCGVDFAKFMVSAREGVLGLLAEIDQLKGIQPGFPPRPPEGEGLPRYGLRWNGPQQPLATPMDDGYWTPWHLAEQLKAENERYRKYGCDTCDGSGHLHRADGEYFGECTSCGAYELEQAKRERDQLKAENEELRKALSVAASRMTDAKACFERDFPGEWSGELHLAVGIKEIDAAVSENSLDKKTGDQEGTISHA